MKENFLQFVYIFENNNNNINILNNRDEFLSYSLCYIISNINLRKLIKLL